MRPIPTSASSPLLAVRPPEYWPRPQFMALIDAAGEVILGDTLQYSRQSFQNRSPVRTPQGRQWLSVPLAGGQHGTPVVDVAVHGRRRWMRKHWRSLHFNYRTSPFFDFYEPELAPLFEREWERLGALTSTSVRVLCRLLGIGTPVIDASELPGRPSSVPAILDACGGGTFLSSEETLEPDRQLTDVGAVLSFNPVEYRQNFDGFEADMSALDLLFNYGPEALSMIRRASTVLTSTAVSVEEGTGT